jgi:predicted RNA-binding Zn-ribbon protein involved in translation (DUF1610 family)
VEEGKIACPACGSAEITRTNKATGRIGFVLLVAGAGVIALLRWRAGSLFGLALAAVGSYLVFKTGREFRCEKCGATWR